MSIDFLLQDVSDLLGLARSAAPSECLPSLNLPDSDVRFPHTAALAPSDRQPGGESLIRQIDDVLRLLNDDSLAF